jgi:predicted amidohydrolase YtcJ
MAHSMLVYPEDVERFNFERSNFIAEISPYQLWVPDPSIRPWIKIIGRDRLDLTMTPLRTIIDAGAVVTYGSDWDNIPQPDPWFALEGMVTRMYPGKPQFGRLNPDERVDVETAIEIFTRNGAMAMETENETGTIEPGKDADFIVVNQNLLEIPPQKIHQTKVLMTVLKGHTVYEAKGKYGFNRSGFTGSEVQ